MHWNRLAKEVMQYISEENEYEMSMKCFSIFND